MRFFFCDLSRTFHDIRVRELHGVAMTSNTKAGVGKFIICTTCKEIQSIIRFIHLSQPRTRFWTTASPSAPSQQRLQSNMLVCPLLSPGVLSWNSSPGEQVGELTINSRPQRLSILSYERTSIIIKPHHHAIFPL